VSIVDTNLKPAVCTDSQNMLLLTGNVLIMAMLKLALAKVNVMF